MTGVSTRLFHRLGASVDATLAPALVSLTGS